MIFSYPAFYFEIGCHYLAQNFLKLVILLSLSPECCKFVTRPNESFVFGGSRG